MIFLLIFLLFVGLISLSVLFYYLHRRVENLTTIVSSIRRESEVLYSNQQTLDGDVKKLFNELQNVNKEITRIRG
jgi:uncharacterized protein YoxC